MICCYKVLLCMRISIEYPLMTTELNISYLVSWTELSVGQQDMYLPYVFLEARNEKGVCRLLCECFTGRRGLTFQVLCMCIFETHWRFAFCLSSINLWPCDITIA